MLDLPVGHPSCSAAGSFAHTFSCEICPAKQSWIKGNFSPALLFDDAQALGRAKAWDVLSLSLQTVPSSDAIVGGTSCVDLSNQKHSEKEGVIASHEGQSSVTFLGLLSYCRRHRPPLVFGENVWNLILVASNWDELVSLFRSIGYVMSFVCADPRYFEVPHRRKRAYYWGFDVSGTTWLR